jgi:hypothetical protein
LAASAPRVRSAISRRSNCAKVGSTFTIASPADVVVSTAHPAQAGRLAFVAGHQPAVMAICAAHARLGSSPVPLPKRSLIARNFAASKP